VNMRLTIDQDVQTLVEAALKSGVEISRTRNDPEAKTAKTAKYQATGAGRRAGSQDGRGYRDGIVSNVQPERLRGGISQKSWQTLRTPRTCTHSIIAPL